MAKVYKTKVPVPTGGEQSLVLLESGARRYGFVSCVCHSDLYAHTKKEIADDLKKYMEDNQVAPFEVQDSELARKVIEEAEQVGTGVSESLTWNLRALLESC